MNLDDVARAGYSRLAGPFGRLSSKREMRMFRAIAAGAPRC
jgi:hypothetical protein